MKTLLIILTLFLASCSRDWQCPVREGTGCKSIREIDKY